MPRVRPGLHYILFHERNLIWEKLPTNLFVSVVIAKPVNKMWLFGDDSGQKGK